MDNKLNNEHEAQMLADESQVAQQTDSFIKLLMNRGLLAKTDTAEERRIAKRKFDRFHNTKLLLRSYRDISWAIEYFPAELAKELDEPYHAVDALLDRVDAELGMGNQRLERRLASLQKSRLLLDHLHQAMEVLRHKPGNGEMMYKVIYEIFMSPEKLCMDDLFYKLSISSRHYYRLRQQAEQILSISLWSAPTSQIAAWLDILALLEESQSL